jgi:hypothetical protein
MSYLIVTPEAAAEIAAINATQTDRQLQPATLRDGRLALPAGIRDMARAGHYWCMYCEALEYLEEVELNAENWPESEEGNP